MSAIQLIVGNFNLNFEHNQAKTSSSKVQGIIILI